MKVSIITSCFNRDATIGQTIESVLAQDYPDIEYIVIDGASSDCSMDVIGRYRDDGALAKVVSEPDDGMYEHQQGHTLGHGRHCGAAAF